LGLIFGGMGLWVDTYRPVRLNELVFHRELGEQLRNLVRAGDFPHLLFYGPSGAGKKTLVSALLRELYGKGVDKVKVETKTWSVAREGATAVDVETTTVASNYHVEINPSTAKQRDTYVVQEVIKEMAATRTASMNGVEGEGGGAGAGGSSSARRFKVIVISEADALSKNAQASLRRTMEKYSGSCRLVLWCESASRIIEAVRSRCLCLRVPAPSEEDVGVVLDNVVRREGAGPLPAGLRQRVVKHAGGNMRRALLALETAKAQRFPFAEDQALTPVDWEGFVAQVANDMMAEQTPRRLYMVRGKLYDLLVNCIPPTLVFKQLVRELLAKLDAELKHEVTHWAAFYEHRMKLGSKAIFHIEAFCAKFMAIYKGYLQSMFG